MTGGCAIRSKRAAASAGRSTSRLVLVRSCAQATTMCASPSTRPPRLLHHLWFIMAHATTRKARKSARQRTFKGALHEAEERKEVLGHLPGLRTIRLMLWGRALALGSFIGCEVVRTEVIKVVRLTLYSLRR
eukprot:5401824-Prymnesium_polylepis.1